MKKIISDSGELSALKKIKKGIMLENGWGEDSSDKVIKKGFSEEVTF